MLRISGECSTMFLSVFQGILRHLFPRNVLLFLNGILQQVMLHFYTSFNILFQQSTASIQGFFLKLILTFPLGTTASIEAFYFKAGCIFLKECRTVFKECYTTTLF